MIPPAHILIVDDEPQIRRSLQSSLASRGWQVDTAENGDRAIRLFSDRRFDIVILDLLMPGIEGVEVVRHIRASSSVPIIVLSVLGGEHHKVEALELGADDYMTKPFGTDELLARIRSLLRRAAAAHRGSIFANGSLHVNFDRREVKVDGQLLKLTPIEYDLLKYMITHAGKVLTHRILLQKILGDAYVDQEQYLRVFVGRLRKKL
ncbi:MAG TPA: response regulator transcription factor [Nitrospira sp.]|nr:response regulator transcription factor [Nitrospira sp.]